MVRALPIRSTKYWILLHLFYEAYMWIISNIFGKTRKAKSVRAPDKFRKNFLTICSDIFVSNNFFSIIFQNQRKNRNFRCEKCSKRCCTLNKMLHSVCFACFYFSTKTMQKESGLLRELSVATNETTNKIGFHQSLMMTACYEIYV